MDQRSHTFIFKVWLLFFLLLFSPFFIHASEDSSSYIEKANAMGLAKDSLWRGLLHYKGGKSRILEDSFFLSSRGKSDAKAELEATIEAYFSGNKNIICQFPARYTWLNEKLGLPGFRIDVETCPALAEWARLDEIDAVSVLYVSGYLGNPASSFGHVLVNLKIKGSDDLLGLFDTSISYGATVPLNENMILYVLKGLFGGYYASFSDKFFYAHDQVYSNREARDIWEYTLDLTDIEKKMFIYHTAELLTKRYRYFFLNANCAQGMALLLDIFIDESVYNHDYPVYVPEELLHRMQFIDGQRRLQGKAGLIKSIKYIPSARRHLFYETARLSQQERDVYRNIVKHPREDLRSLLGAVDEGGRIDVLNALLAYQYYKLMASDEGNEDEGLKVYKDKILLERLRLPAKKEEPLLIPELASPKELSPPSSFNLGFVAEKGNKPFALIGATIFRKESVGLNALEYNELVALGIDFGIRSTEGDVFVDRFDFLKIRDFRTFYIKEAGENPLSWRVRAGMDRYEIDKDVSYDYVLDGGVGLVSKAGDAGIYYGFINASLHSNEQHYRVGPMTGVVLEGPGPLKLQLDYGLEFGLEHFESQPVLQGKLQYQMNKENAIQIFYEKNNRDRLGVNYIRYW